MLRSILVRALPFTIAAIVGYSVVELVAPIKCGRPVDGFVSHVSGSGHSGFASDPSPDRTLTETPGSDELKDNRKRLMILSKPRPAYTEEARSNNIQGTVILKVAFLGNGSIGMVQPVKSLPNGLTEQAIEAAKRIKFKPAGENGVGKTVIKSVEYTFRIY